MSNPGPELFKALLAFQATNPSVAKGGDNPHFRSKYITLEDLTSVARACNKHGLIFYHHMDSDDSGADFCVTTVAHAESGQYVEARVRLLYGKSNPQGQGSAATYARRYGLGALLALCDTKDDDAIGAMESTGRQFQKDERTGKGRWSGAKGDDVPFDGGGTEQPPQQEKPRHHESWDDLTRKAFCAALTQELGVRYEDVASYSQSLTYKDENGNERNNPRPSGMDDNQRRRLLDHLRSERGRQRLNQWKEKQ